MKDNSIGNFHSIQGITALVLHETILAEQIVTQLSQESLFIS